MIQTKKPVQPPHESVMTGLAPTPYPWLARFRTELAQVAARDRWGQAFLGMAAVNLAAFAACQALYDPNITQDNRMLLTWLADLVGSWVVFRAVAGRWGYPGTSAPGVVIRTWVTFFILTFNSVLMNVQTGWSIHWYRLAWPTLSTFGFAMLAWLVDLRFLVFAVQMWLTGMVMVRLSQWNYAIYGTSWSLALVVIGSTLTAAARRRG